ncbi:MAG: hypothetical protein HUJ56_08835 [Erysipelotrichaceae bacterium]|nr:hypothetical protein [Erysipelotrichaceae bacterium]
MKKICYSDATLKNARRSLSFREKVETAKLLDRLQIEAIELAVIENVQVDSLLTKSIAAAVTNAVVCLPVALSEAGVATAWAAVQSASHARLQVEIPVSPIQMEYQLHKKAPVVKDMAEGLIKKCKEVCTDVEFVACDATRADAAFLKDMIEMAVANGATKVTVTDDEGIFMPNELGEFAKGIKALLPEGVEFGIATSDTLGMACISAVEAIIAGADAVRVAAYGNVASIEGVTKILNARCDKCQATPGVKTTEMSRNIKAIRRMNDGDKKAMENITTEEVSVGDITKNDDIKVVANAIAKLGYDLSDEDIDAVFAEVKNATAKKNISAKELDAIIATTALQVPSAYQLVSYVINAGNTIASTASMEIEYNGEKVTGVSRADGPIDAAFMAIEQIIGHHYELDDFQIQSITEGREAMGEALIRLRSDDGRLYSGRGLSTDIIGASIRAYISAVNKIVFEQ